MGRKTIAYIAPFFVFMLFIPLLGWMDDAHATPRGLAAVYFVFPVQTVVCAGILAWYWRVYRLAAPRRAGVAAGIGLLVFGIWVSPQLLFHQPARLSGFDPAIFTGHPRLYWAEVIMRFLRLAIVVPLLEEIFWRGFLLRYIATDDFESMPFGTWSMKANLLVALGFMLEHSPPDWPAGLAAGFLYNMVAYRTRSLSSCVIAHGLTNLLLGFYIMSTGQWGFW